MKWLVGAVILAVVAAVASGRVPMAWVVYSFAALFASLGAALGFAYWRNRHPGLLLMGIIYFVSALAAVVLGHWWPLLAGFAVLWVLRAMGMEPPAQEPQSPAAVQSAPPDKPA
jgi:hypothetical protein